MTRQKPKTTSWQQVGDWYDKSVGREGHYYHQSIVLPGVLRLLQMSENPPARLIDLGCGQGVLARQLPPSIDYLGLDIAPNLIKEAQRYDKNRRHHYRVHDITQPLQNSELFDAAALILSLQNIEKPDAVLHHLGHYLAPEGRVVLVLNHPCFRIPRQSFWQIDEAKRCRYRRIERYLSPMQIPIQMNPSLGEESAVTWSFHHPLSSYCQWLQKSGFSIETMEEWCSNKQSSGKNAKMENLSRKEFPLFLAILAKKQKN